MKKTVIILGHPNLDKSIANKAIVEEASKLDNIEIRDISKLYPDFKIDVKAEQDALLEADRLVFQYPIYWYNMPSILKHWFDTVLTFGFAYGANSYKLEGKEMLVSVTTGGPEEGYVEGMMDSKILFPLKGSADFCKMKYLSPIVLHGIMAMPGNDTKPLIKKAEQHSKKLIQILKN